MTNLTAEIRRALEDGGIHPRHYQITPVGGDAYNRETYRVTDTHMICKQPLLDASYRGAPFTVDPAGLYSILVHRRDDAEPEQLQGSDTRDQDGIDVDAHERHLAADDGRGPYADLERLGADLTAAATRQHHETLTDQINRLDTYITRERAIENAARRSYDIAEDGSPAKRAAIAALEHAGDRRRYLETRMDVLTDQLLAQAD